MATIRLICYETATKLYLTSLGGTGDPEVGGYNLVHVAGVIHDAVGVTGLVGAFYGSAKDASGTVLGRIYRVDIVDDDDVTIDTTAGDVPTAEENADATIQAATDAGGIAANVVAVDDQDATATAEVDFDELGGGLTDDQQDQLDRIEAKTGLIGTGSATVSSPVAANGTINGPIVIDSDYLADNDRAFQWTIDAITGVTVGTATTRFGIGKKHKSKIWVAGTVSDNEDGTWLLSHDLKRTDTDGMTSGLYDWSVEVRSGDDVSYITVVRNASDNYAVELVCKQTDGD